MHVFLVAKNRLMLSSVCGLLLIAFVSCKKGSISTDPLSPSVEIPVTPPPPPPPPVPSVDVPSNAVVLELGTGDGNNLNVDGISLKISGNTIIKIKGGRYKSIVIKNITGTAAQPVYVKNDGLVTVSEVMQIENIANVVIAGDNIPDLKYGFKFENISYRAITLGGRINGITLKSMSFINVANYTFAGQLDNTSLPYDGTEATRNERFKILGCLFDNAGTIQFGGNLNKDKGEDTGLFKDVEIAYNTFQNSAGVGAVCSFTNVQDYDIHHNVVNNINQNNNQHNGVFFMQGNGKFHDNKLTNYQGNAIRMWLYSRGNTPATNEIYNNLCYNTRKYSGFELQGFERNYYPGKSTFANAKVYNNTVGSMNVSKDWEGQLLDLYGIGGTLEYYNNLGFNLNSVNSSTITNMLNSNGATVVTKDVNNRYFANQADAVNDGFASKYLGIGAP
jgi:hypothetical protein